MQSRFLKIKVLKNTDSSVGPHGVTLSNHIPKNLGSSTSPSKRSVCVPRALNRKSEKEAVLMGPSASTREREERMRDRWFKTMGVQKLSSSLW